MARMRRIVEESVDSAMNDSTVQSQITTDPQGALNKFKEITLKSFAEKSALHTDVWVYRIVAFFLGAVVFTAIIGAIKLALNDIPTTPNIMTAIGSASVGALAGLLAPSPIEK